MTKSVQSTGLGFLLVFQGFSAMSSDRLEAFPTDELHALAFRLDVAETVEPLDEVAAELRGKMIRELKEREE